MNALLLWMMKLLFVPSIIAGSTKTLRISDTNANALGRMDSKNFLHLTRITKLSNTVDEPIESIWEVSLSSAGVEYMKAYTVLPPLKVGMKIKTPSSQSVFEYAFREEKANGTITLWVRNRFRELIGIDAKTAIFA